MKGMKKLGTIVLDGVQVGVLCKQNGRYYIMENANFEYKKAFNTKKEAWDAIVTWWKN